MSYVRHRTSMLRRGFGDSIGGGLATDSGAGPQFDATGRYLGGSPLMDWYCNSFLGSWTQTCSIRTPAQITADQAAELAQTQLTQANQQAAVAAGNAAVKTDAAANPSDYQQQIAAANHPTLAAIFGPQFVAALFPVDVSDPNNPTATFPWLSLGLIFIGGALVLKAIR